MKDKPMTSQQAERLIAALENLGAKPSLAEYAPSSPRNQLQVNIDAATKMFDALRDVNLHPSTRQFIDSLEGGFEDYGSLTPKQMKALTDNYNWFINGIPFTR